MSKVGMSEDTLYSAANGIATITFNRPAVANALHIDQVPRILAMLRQAESDGAVRCIVINGNGKHFMAGGDLSVLPALMEMDSTQRRWELEKPIHNYNVIIRTMRRLPKPIIASVQGAVAGAAVGLVAACDLSITTRSSYYFLAHILHGGSNDGMATYFLPRQIGTRKTLEMALLAERVSGEEAQRLGFVNYVVDDDKLAAETATLAARLAAGPTAGYGLIKNLVYSSLGNTLEEHGRLEAETYAASGMTEDWEEGIKAFFEKRKPQFKGC
jgi:2-(1,2-epoxy-1,2-dihydrophenyl)acetyl-CoA isomerase